MSISQATGAFANANGTNLATLAVTNITVGNYRVIVVKIASNSFTVTGVSGGGVNKWNIVNSIGNANGHFLSMWGGIVNTTGAQTITVTYSATPGASCDLMSSELVWSGGAAPRWTVEATGGLVNAASTTIAFPTLVSGPTTDQAYWGFAQINGTGLAGSTTGFTYSTVDGNGNYGIFNGSLSANTSYSPTGSATASDASTTIAAIFNAGPNVPDVPLRQTMMRASFR